MTKTDFTLELCERLSGIPFDEVDERLSFYIEMIDDKIDEGMSEDEAVASIGDVNDIATEILSDIPLSIIVKDKIKNNRKMKVWEIVLLILGFPVWFPILILFFAVVLSVYVSMWSVIISLWAAFVSTFATTFAGIIAAVYLVSSGFALSGLFLFSCTLICGGLSIFLFFGCKYSTKGLLILTKKIALLIKRSFVKKEEL